jgi:hypothetical protein
VTDEGVIDGARTPSIRPCPTGIGEPPGRGKCAAPAKLPDSGVTDNGVAGGPQWDSGEPRPGAGNRGTGKPGPGTGARSGKPGTGSGNRERGTESGNDAERDRQWGERNIVLKALEVATHVVAV